MKTLSSWSARAAELTICLWILAALVWYFLQFKPLFNLIDRAFVQAR